MKRLKNFYWACFIIFSVISLLGVGILCIHCTASSMIDRKEQLKMSISSNQCWKYITGEKVRSVAISDDGKYITASTNSPDSSAYFFDNRPSNSKTPLWKYSNKSRSYSVNYRSTEQLYFNEYWYEYEHIKTGHRINFSAQSTPSVMSFAIWDQTFENFPNITKYGGEAENIQLPSDTYDYYWIFLRSGSTITYNFTSTDPIDFFIADAEALYLWEQGLPHGFYVDLQDNSFGNGSFVVPTTQDYYLVWYNEGMTSVSVDYMINYTALHVPDLSVADFHVEAVDSIPEQTYVVPNEGKWYFFIYFEPMNSPEESTTITFDVTYDIGNSMNTVDISANGDYIAAANDDNYVYFLNKSMSDTQEPVWDFLGDTYFNDVAISDNGLYTVAATGNGTIYLLFNLAFGSNSELWHNDTGDFMHSVAISGTGDYIATGGWDGKLYFFSKNSPTPLWTYFTGSKIYSVAISLDGNSIVAGTHDNRVLFFNRGNSTPLWSYSAGGEIYTVAINENGTYIIAGGAEGILYLFDHSGTMPLWNYNAGASIGASDFHRCLAISNDGTYIVAGTRDSMLYYFERSSSVPLWSNSLGGEINAITMSANGSYIVAGSNDHGVYLFGHGVDCQPPSEPPIIPGYGILLTVGLICLISIISIKKQITS